MRYAAVAVVGLLIVGFVIWPVSPSNTDDDVTDDCALLANRQAAGLPTPTSPFCSITEQVDPVGAGCTEGECDQPIVDFGLVD